MMTTVLTGVVIAGTVVSLVFVAALTWLVAIALLDRDVPGVWEWERSTAAGRHRAPDTLWAQIARDRHHVARHSEKMIPPSIRVPTLLMDPVRRAAELRRQLGAGAPALPLPVRVHLAPTAWAARLGRPAQLGMGRAIGGTA